MFDICLEVVDLSSDFGEIVLSLQVLVLFRLLFLVLIQCVQVLNLTWCLVAKASFKGKAHKDKLWKYAMASCVPYI